MLYPNDFIKKIGKPFVGRKALSDANKIIEKPWLNATNLRDHLKKQVSKSILKEGSVGIIHLNRGLATVKGKFLGHYCNFIIKNKKVIFVDFAKKEGDRVFTNPDILDEALHAFGKTGGQGYRYVDVTDVILK